MNKFIIFALLLAAPLSTTFAEKISPKESLPLRIIAAGNFVQDRFYAVPDNFIENNGLKNGDTVLITKEKERALLAALSALGLELLQQNSGGATANTTVGLRYLGLPVGLIGALTKDIPGDAYINSLTQKGIKYRITPPQKPEDGSGACYIFVTGTHIMSGDRSASKKIERTMATSLGVAGDVHVSQEDIDWVSSADMFLAEGYLFNSTAYQSMFKLAKGAKSKGKLVALSIASGFCATTYRDLLNDFIQSYADIVVGDNTEARTLTGASDDLGAVKALQAMGKKGAVTCSAEGAYVFDETHIYFIESPRVNVIDATGAGDQFAAGFLYEILQSGNIIRAGQLGSYCAGEVIQVLGGHPPASLAASVASGAPWQISYREIH